MKARSGGSWQTSRKTLRKTESVASRRGGRRVVFTTRFSVATIRLTEVNALSVFTRFMKVVSSIKSAKKRHPACQVVRRRGKIYVINKVEPRYKARQG